MGKCLCASQFNYIEYKKMLQKKNLLNLNVKKNMFRIILQSDVSNKDRVYLL